MSADGLLGEDDDVVPGADQLAQHRTKWAVESDAVRPAGTMSERFSTAAAIPGTAASAASATSAAAAR